MLNYSSANLFYVLIANRMKVLSETVIYINNFSHVLCTHLWLQCWAWHTRICYIHIIATYSENYVRRKIPYAHFRKANARHWSLASVINKLIWLSPMTNQHVFCLHPTLGFIRWAIYANDDVSCGTCIHNMKYVRCILHCNIMVLRIQWVKSSYNLNFDNIVDHSRTNVHYLNFLYAFLRNAWRCFTQFSLFGANMLMQSHMQKRNYTSQL